MTWKADAQRAVLLIHDMQRYFVEAFDHEDPQSQIRVAMKNILALRDAADDAGVPVVYTAQPPNQTPADRALLTDFWGTGLTDDGREEIVQELAPRAGDLVLSKWRYSAFARTDLQEWMRQAGRDQLLITGVYAHIGCLTTALDAFMRDIQPFFVADAQADFSLEEHQMAINYGYGRCASVVNSVSVLKQIQATLVAAR
ncbi:MULTISPECIES: isochorismatase family protein [unclassified Glutamicibacter]|uniref:isochorismatase family protein n=2 Tax=unclassified Glutamicibacter TaxID=2627139 RepID=UPI0020D0CCE3|nr:isochorismatase family protein [Glutamicibacter sp. BW80]